MVIRAAWQTVVMLPVFLAFFFVASRCLRRFERRSRGWHLPYKKVIDARTIAVEMRCTICRIFQSPSSRLYRALEFVLHLAESQQPAVGWRTASNTGFHKQICQSYPQASSPGNGRRSTCWTDKQCQVHLHATLRCASEHHASGQSSVREGQTARRALDGWCGCFRFFFYLLAFGTVSSSLGNSDAASSIDLAIKNTSIFPTRVTYTR